MLEERELLQKCLMSDVRLGSMGFFRNVVNIRIRCLLLHDQHIRQCDGSTYVLHVALAEQTTADENKQRTYHVT